MINSTFVAFLSFILFMGIAFRFGYRKSIAALDDRIAEIKKTLEEASHEKKEAAKALQLEQHRHTEILSEIDTLLKRTEEEMATSKQKALHDLEKTLESRQMASHMALDRIRIDAIDEIKNEVAFLTQKSLEEIIGSFTEKQHQVLNQYSLDLIQAELFPIQPANGQERIDHKPFHSVNE